jgi:hypothetical protein
MKKIIRNFIVFIEQKTRKWVVPSSIWNKLDKEDMSAKNDLSDIAVKWGTLDPEFIRASLLLRKLEFHKNIEELE